MQCDLRTNGVKCTLAFSGHRSSSCRWSNCETCNKTNTKITFHTIWPDIL